MKNHDRLWLAGLALSTLGLGLSVVGVFKRASLNEAHEQVNIVCVEWLDAKGEQGWMTVDEYDPVARMVSCGHLVREGDDFVILALDRALDESDPVVYNQLGSIPRGMVQKLWRVQ